MCLIRVRDKLCRSGPDLRMPDIDAVNEIALLVSPVIPSHSTKSHDFFNAHGGIFSANVFPS